jgi:hypothetical protein
MKQMFKLTAAVALTAAGAAAQAAPFYLDIGALYQAPAGDQMCATCTSMKDEFTLKYRSSSVVTDMDASGTITAGDKIVTTGGLAAGGGVQYNAVTGLNPGGFGGPSDNGFGATWGMTFSVTGLTGIISSVTSAGVPLLQYGPGSVLHLYLIGPGSLVQTNFMNIDILGGASDGLGTGLFGQVDFTGTSGTWGNLFHSGTYSCGGSTGFYDIWKNCGAGAALDLSFDFLAHFDSNVFVTDFSPDGTDSSGRQQFLVTSNHDGSATFSIPEPGSLALVGLGLLGAGMVRRRKASK